MSPLTPINNQGNQWWFPNDLTLEEGYRQMKIIDRKALVAALIMACGNAACAMDADPFDGTPGRGAGGGGSGAASGSFTEAAGLSPHLRNSYYHTQYLLLFSLISTPSQKEEALQCLIDGFSSVQKGDDINNLTAYAVSVIAYPEANDVQKAVAISVLARFWNAIENDYEQGGWRASKAVLGGFFLIRDNNVDADTKSKVFGFFERKIPDHNLFNFLKQGWKEELFETFERLSRKIDFAIGYSPALFQGSIALSLIKMNNLNFPYVEECVNPCVESLVASAKERGYGEGYRSGWEHGDAIVKAVIHASVYVESKRFHTLEEAERKDLTQAFLAAYLTSLK